MDCLLAGKYDDAALKLHFPQQDRSIKERLIDDNFS